MNCNPDNTGATDTGNASERRTAPRLAIVCPCYNEQDSLDGSLKTLSELLDTMQRDGLVSPDSYVLVANDGSRDRSADILRNWHARNPARFKAIFFARNAGHQNAIMAGMLETLTIGADCVITMDTCWLN